MHPLVELILRLIKQNVKVSTFTGTVTAVDTGKPSCNVQPDDEGAEIEDVRLMASIDNAVAGVVLYPKVNTKCIVLLIDGNENNCYLLKANDYENVEIDINGNFTMSIADNGDVVINNGSNGGIIKVSPMTSKFNDVIAEINALKTIFNSWTVVPNDGGFALKTAITSWSTSNMSSVVNGDFENTKIKH